MQEDIQAKLDRIVSLKTQRDAIDAELCKELGIVVPEKTTRANKGGITVTSNNIGRVFGKAKRKIERHQKEKANGGGLLLGQPPSPAKDTHAADPRFTG